MKLIDLINLRTEDEVTVGDEVYDMEAYFYKDEGDLWADSLCKIAERLDVVKTLSNGVAIVNLTKLIEDHMDGLKEADLFISYDIDDIMEDMTSILAGNVSEKWMAKFANVLCEGEPTNSLHIEEITGTIGEWLDRDSSSVPADIMKALQSAYDLAVNNYTKKGE